jgi:hypothetical protein
MKTTIVTSTLLTILFFFSAPLCAESQSTEDRPYIGLMLDRNPLPDLLLEHLQLSPDHGVRVANVHRDSPADKAGLGRGDIVIRFQGDDVASASQLSAAVHEAGVGAEVSLEIIHLGQRKTIKLTLEPFPGDFDWKYPAEPEMMHSWQPGKFFRLGPDDKNWIIEVPGSDESSVNILNVLQGVFSCQYAKGDENYTITIEGDPYDDDTRVTVQVRMPDYKTTVKEIDDLPRKYSASAKEALEHARKAHKKRQTWQFPAPGRPQLESEERQRLFDRFFHPRQPVPPVGPDDQTPHRIEERMRDLQERLEQLEKRQKEMLDRLSEKLDERESEKPDEPIRPESTESEKI